MIRRPPRSTLDRSSAASDVYKRQPLDTNAGGAATYTEIIPAVYGNYVYESKKIEAEIGLRVEYVDLQYKVCLLYTSPSPRDRTRSRMPSSA